MEIYYSLGESVYVNCFSDTRSISFIELSRLFVSKKEAFQSQTKFFETIILFRDYLQQKWALMKNEELANNKLKIKSK